MKELNDNDFDQAFKSRVNEEYLEFEEESWLKMEKKLQRRDRMVWLRIASIILLFLSFGLGFYFFNLKEQQKQETAGRNKPQKQQEQVQKPVVDTPKATTELAQEKPAAKDTYAPVLSGKQPKMQQPTVIIPIDNSTKPLANNAIANLVQAPAKNLVPADQKPSNPAQPVQPVNPVQKTEQTDQQLIAQLTSPSINAPDTADSPVKKAKTKRKIPISLAISVGPDFNSTNSLVGGKGTAAFGFTVGVGLTKKLAVQTGVIYGAKNYTANSYDYHFSNPNAKNIIAQIDAACKVLEIPLRASYTVSNNNSRSIELNGGLSSYLMLRENYVFKYNASANRTDRTIELINANRHFLSVLDLSATYNIKLNSKFGLGIEPYVKIPLSGIGEGNVPLKSSGVSLKLRYDLNKK